MNTLAEIQIEELDSPNKYLQENCEQTRLVKLREGIHFPPQTFVQTLTRSTIKIIFLMNKLNSNLSSNFKQLSAHTIR